MQQGASVSVAMATFDGARFLRDQLESIAEQTVAPAELVVCDDGSTDQTLDVIRDFAARAPFPVRLTVNRQRLGPVKNFERAIAACSGDIIFLADQDDVWKPQKIETILRTLDRDESVAGVFTDARIVDRHGAVVAPSLWSHLGFSAAARSEVMAGDAFDVLVVRNFATGATMAFRARERDLLLPIPDDHAMVHDRWIALLLAGARRITAIAEPLIDYRAHEDQQIGPGPSPGFGRWMTNVRETGPRAFAEWSGQLQLVAERLEREGSATSRDRLPALQKRIDHLRVRAAMPDNIVTRIRPVTRELLQGHYHRYSNAFWSVAKDLFRAYSE